MCSPIDRQDTLAANRALHAAESAVFDLIHPELTSKLQARRDRSAIAFMTKGSGSAAPDVLDAGCGTGNLSILFLEHGCRVSALDLSPHMLGIFARKLRTHPLAGRVSMHCEDVDAFLDRDHLRFDIISFRAMLHHLADYVGTIRKACGLLRPGGYIYISHEPVSGQSRRRKALVRRVNQMDFLLFRASLYLHSGLALPPLDYRKSDPHAPTGLDVGRIREILESAGVRVELLETYGPWKTELMNWLDETLLSTRHQFRLIARRAGGA